MVCIFLEEKGYDIESLDDVEVQSDGLTLVIQLDLNKDNGNFKSFVLDLRRPIRDDIDIVITTGGEFAPPKGWNKVIYLDRPCELTDGLSFKIELNPIDFSLVVKEKGKTDFNTTISSIAEIIPIINRRLYPIGKEIREKEIDRIKNFTDRQKELLGYDDDSDVEEAIKEKEEEVKTINEEIRKLKAIDRPLK